MSTKLFITAELNNVTDLKAIDTVESPFEYTFKIQCTKCREIHSKNISINRFEKHELEGSRGEANFTNKCDFCSETSNCSISIPKKYESYKIEQNNKRVAILEIDARGLELVEFIPEGLFSCKGAETSTVFEEVDLSEGEWYDYDERAGEEVSITEISWDISKK